MSRASVDAVVEQIMTDPDYAETVADQGAAALGSFDLTDDEQATIVAAVQRVLPEPGDEVEGHGISPGLQLLPSLIGGNSHGDEIQLVNGSWGASQVSGLPGSGGSKAGKVNLSAIKLSKP